MKTKTIAHCRQSQITVERIDTRAICNVKIWWRDCLLAQLSLLWKKGHKPTWLIWNRGESPQSLVVLWSARAGSAGTTTLDRDDDSRVTGLFSTPEMTTPPFQPPDWDLLASVENETPSYCPTPLTTSGPEPQDLSAPTPAQYRNSHDHDQWARSVSVVSQSLPAHPLAFVQLENWDREAVPDKSNPSCIYYDIEWMVVVEKTTPTRNTETTRSKNTDHDIVLEPQSYSTTILVPELKEVLQRKFPAPQSGEIKDTEVTVSAIGRLEVEFVREYPKTNIDWLEVRKQLLKRSDSFQTKKRLRVKIKFRYVDVADQRVTNSSKKRGREARGTATENQLAICFSKQTKPPDWQVVYAKRRCSGRPACPGGHDHCPVHPKTGKPYVLKTHYMRILVENEVRDKSADSYREVPADLIALLDEEEDRSRRKKEQDNKMAPTSATPIQITNVLPGHMTPEPQIVGNTERATIDIPGYAKDNIQEYCDWHGSRYKKASSKAGYQKAAEFLIEGGHKLEVLFEHPIAEYLSKRGKVPRGIADAIMNRSCIQAWSDDREAKRRKLDSIQDLTSEDP